VEVKIGKRETMHDSTGGKPMRLNFEFSEERIKELKALQAELDIDMKTLMNNALSIFEWCVEETKRGNEIAAVNEAEKTYRVLITPLLQSLAKKHNNALAVQEHAHA
jgi:hypothetical protein